MKPETKNEIQRAQRYLQGDGLDKEGALRGINDWFWQSLIEEGYMDVRKGHPRFYKLLEELADLHERKNQNYATHEDPLSNLRECEGMGVDAFKGTLVRLCDKWCRIKNLAKGVPDLVGESIVDTLRDMAIYSLLAIILWEEKHEAKTNSDTVGSDSSAL